MVDTASQPSADDHGGHRVAEVLADHGVRHLFTLCGGHISPILVGAKERGISVVDMRHEAAAVFAADATARMTGIPGAAAVTAGPGATNTITAVKNAQMAQSPVVVLGGAAATLLAGRGALQDMDQVALFSPHVKRAERVVRVGALGAAVRRAMESSAAGVPGPIFVETPVDLLYPEDVVRGMYRQMTPSSHRPAALALRSYIRLHLFRQFRGPRRSREPAGIGPQTRAARDTDVDAAAGLLGRAERPLLLVGSQAVLNARAVEEVASAAGELGIPMYGSGMARGLLGTSHPLQFRYRRRRALAAADLVVLAGVTADFRLDYGRQIPRSTEVIAVNRAKGDLTRNRKPTIAVHGDPGLFLTQLAARAVSHPDWTGWRRDLRDQEAAAAADLTEFGDQDVGLVNPVRLLSQIDEVMAENSVVVADGGDFVGTASYAISPRGPLAWLDPGPFGTLGVGGGFAAAAKLARPEAEIWLLYGDGSAAYSLAEFDTYVRHGLGIIAVVGNDASWSQIAREQKELLKDDVGTVLRRTDYHVVAEGYGGKGFLVTRPAEVPDVLAAAKDHAANGTPVLVNVLIGSSDFRKGSISI